MKGKNEIKAGVLVHGYPVLAEPRFGEEGASPWYRNWQYIIWGNIPMLGIVAKGIHTAMRQRAEVIVFGTGATRDENDKVESEIIRDYAIEWFGSLGQFQAFRDMPVFEDKDIENGRKWLEAVSIAETESKNAMQELRMAKEVFEKKQVESIFFVTSPDHAPWVARAAAIVYGGEFDIYIVPSDVPYTYAGPEGVQVIEPLDNKVESCSTSS
jgi:uncharacterized SAM-binding protein YcdF (DUF218 family)